jgi:TadE-like protein
MNVRSRQRGQSMVEFGLLALLFTLILFGIADFGMLLNGWVAVSSAARDSGRRASIGQRVEDVSTAARKFAPIPGVPPAALKVVTEYCLAGDFACAAPYATLCDTAPQGYTCDPWSPTYPTPPQALPIPNPNDVVRVIVVADTFEVITPLVRPFFTDPTRCPGGNSPRCYVPILSSITMRYEGPPPS